jgi:hypothetical protein
MDRMSSKPDLEAEWLGSIPDDCEDNTDSTA